MICYRARCRHHHYFPVYSTLYTATTTKYIHLGTLTRIKLVSNGLGTKQLNNSRLI